MPQSKTIKGRASQKHIHKYMKVQLKYTKLWRCALPECTHHMPAHLEELVLGRYSICWGCGHEFRLDPRAMTEEMPMCLDCVSPDIEVKIDSKLPKQAGILEYLQMAEGKK